MEKFKSVGNEAITKLEVFLYVKTLYMYEILSLTHERDEGEERGAAWR